MMKHVHLIGIAGSGLSAIARLLLESGYTVSGSDRQANDLTRELEALGARVYIGQSSDQIRGADVIVRSSAVSDDNPEVVAGQSAKIPVLKRADFLGYLTSGHTTIAIAGTHGKTTTTAMVAWMLTSLHRDPSYIIGGVSIDLGANAHAGKGDEFVIEADEYDRMFLGLKPNVAIITNVEHDHPDCFPTIEDYDEAFATFTSQLQTNGILLDCADDPGSLKLEKEIPVGCQVQSYGLSSTARYQASITGSDPEFGFKFTANYHGKSGKSTNLGSVSLIVPGEHNVRNALAAIAVAHTLDLPMLEAAQALSQYHGTGRRFEVIGKVMGITIVNDYAHHPTEIQATLAAARSRYPSNRIWAVWQPHTYTRTRSLAPAFIKSFKLADQVVVLEVYAAREAKQDYSANEIVAEMDPTRAVYMPNFYQAHDYLIRQLTSGDILLVLSAGDADQISEEILKTLKEKENQNA